MFFAEVSGEKGLEKVKLYLSVLSILNLTVNVISYSADYIFFHLISNILFLDIHIYCSMSNFLYSLINE